MTASPLKPKLEALIGALRRLCVTLNEEKDALVDHEVAALSRVTQTKERIVGEVQQLTAALGSQPLSEQIQAVALPARTELEALHKTTKLLAISAQSQNLVNGKIIRRSQQSARELIALMHGKDTEALYGQTGRTTNRSAGDAIARA